MNIKFNALEYTADDKFVNSEYEYTGDKNSGWEIKRNGSDYLKLGSGYELLKTKLCGVCSTDIARRFLPFPLPQITGHELVAETLDGKQHYVVEINDTPAARGDLVQDAFCDSGIPTHSPTRLVLGIDRLPGGFGPYILAPQHAIVPYEKISDRTAVMIEPFAAGLQAVIASPPKSGDSVAVLGPRRLGSLLIAALKAYKESYKIDFQITALARHDELLVLAGKLGADNGVNLTKTDPKSLYKTFDIVYDTTSTEAGFKSALEFAKREVHLKTTNGQVMCGFSKLTELVVDELSILPFNEKNLDFKWEKETHPNERIFSTKEISLENKNLKLYQTDISHAEKILESEEFANRLPRFDLGIATSLEEIDLLIRPNVGHENSLVRPRGAILFKGDSHGNQMLEFINAGGSIRTSRCGDFHLAIKLLEENRALADSLSENMISHIFPAEKMNEAFTTAKDSKAIKVVVEHT
ncbi:MAG: alcohol dehydrogenase catalytic domain-containing protein [Leptospiraceae bacterium]|nr:alcohol dehydrogenase catalytic domain-containing protein [Leptospiraceae bacterium]